MSNSVCLEFESARHVIMLDIFFFKDAKVFCSFCEEGFESSKKMMDHLLMCGNKTDQCPNCEKYIRRAIFAYHYENNCAELDEASTDDNPKQAAPRGKLRSSFVYRY